MGSVEAAIPCDDWPLRRTLKWNEPGPKAKEWGTERPWSGWESGAGAGTLFNRELSIPGFFQILCLMALLSSHLLAPVVCFHSGLRECSHVCGMCVSG